ncbi:PREDICTED: 12S seed storage protein CRD [Tarenaya hassleriana]|uniref:12S seed storage protein CRD n=1 Tax=Tarenaya hassleriana TaxID=28532 RepID=UPI00053C0D11|nr:PREDICTED: 12S seed storage protein CRD [Tarenaya hassleriana]
MKTLMPSLVSICLALLVIFDGGETRQQEVPLTSACRFERLNSLEPTETAEMEGGRMEFWDHTSPELRCGGVAMARVTIEPKSIFLPSFFTSPGLAYVVQGEGVMGMVRPGCPETYDEGGMEAGETGRRRFGDMHQKVENFRRGHVFALLAGISHWCYNNGDSPVVIVLLLDITNRDNHLDQKPRVFQIAGSGERGGRTGKGHVWVSSKNIFSGFDPKIIAEAFKIDLQTAKKLQSQRDDRGNIVRVKGKLHFVSPRIEQGRAWERDNGVEETICSARMHENIDDPSRADFYSSRAGRISTLNSFTLPVLRLVRLNAVRGLLYSGGMVLPHWTPNAHTVIYTTGGRARVQVVDDNGRSVFDGELRQGQILLVPQGYAVVKRSGQTGYEWVAFKTNDHAITNSLSGRTSYMRAVPLDVISAAYGTSEEVSKRIKFSQQESMLSTTTTPDSV